MRWVAIIGDDGMRPVVWGLGGAMTVESATEDAREDALDWLAPTMGEPDYAPEVVADMTAVEVDEHTARRIQHGIVGCAELGIRVG